MRQNNNLPKIDKSNFNNWRDDPVTAHIFSMLTELHSNLEEQMLNPEVFLSPEGRVNLARLLGNKEIVERILSIRFDDIVEEEKDENFETMWG